MIDLTEAIKAGRELAEELPEFDYQKTYTASGAVRARCEYVDENTLQGKCFWGRVFVDKLGMDPQFFMRDDAEMNTEGVYHILKQLGYSGTREQVDWMGLVQDGQDTGMTFARAIQRADEDVDH